jgi:hypothetical protein
MQKLISNSPLTPNGGNEGYGKLGNYYLRLPNEIFVPDLPVGRWFKRPNDGTILCIKKWHYIPDSYDISIQTGNEMTGRNGVLSDALGRKLVSENWELLK